MKEVIIELIKKWACMHKYEKLESSEGFAVDYYLYNCNKCGKFKRIRL